MNKLIGRSKDVVIKYNQMNELFGLTPIEYLVWTALIIACTKIYEKSEHANSVTIADICREIQLSTKVVQRAMDKLAEKNLAQKIKDRWIYVPNPAATEKEISNK